jgi:hypothetical protein
MARVIHLSSCGIIYVTQVFLSKRSTELSKTPWFVYRLVETDSSQEKELLTLTCWTRGLQAKRKKSEEEGRGYEQSQYC